VSLTDISKKLQSYILDAETKRVAVIVIVMKLSTQPVSTNTKYFQKLFIIFLAQWLSYGILHLGDKNIVTFQQ